MATSIIINVHPSKIVKNGPFWVNQKNENNQKKLFIAKNKNKKRHKKFLHFRIFLHFKG